MIRFINPAEDYVKLTLAHLRSLGIKQIGFVKTELSFCDLMQEAFEKNLKPGETFKVVATMLAGETDVKPALLKMRKSKADIFGLYMLPTQLISLFREAKAQEFKVKGFGTTTFESDALMRTSLAAMNGMFYVHGWVEPGFLDRYLEIYGNGAEVSYAANAYDFANLVADLFGENSKLQGVDVLKQFESVKSRKGVTGSFSYHATDDGDRYFEFPLAVKEIVDGKVVTVEASR